MRDRAGDRERRAGVGAPAGSRSGAGALPTTGLPATGPVATALRAKTLRATALLAVALVLAGCATGPAEPSPAAAPAVRTAPGEGAPSAQSTLSAPSTLPTTPTPSTPATAPTPTPVVAPDTPWRAHDAVPADALGAGYSGTVTAITPELAQRMAASWRPGCPVPLADLRYVTVTHHDFEGGTATGELVVHADVADSVVAVFGELFALGYPVRSMRLVDDFAGSDDASMAADNTSAFNCRPISRGTGWSEHAYGRAIDLNPVENPYVRGSLVLPPEGAAFADRSAAPGVLLADDAVVRAFAAHGWQWGGEWISPVDYQHFSTTGR